MTSLLFGVVHNGGVPADEKVVRMTTSPVDNTAPPAVADDAPDFNELKTDPNPNLGLATRQVASAWHEKEQGMPQWAGQVSDSTKYNAIINQQVSSSGTAAAREAVGQWGHGTMRFAEGIEPVGDMKDGGRLGNEYFAVGKPDIGSTSENGVVPPPGYETTAKGMVDATARDRAREAAQAAIYARWLDS